jgi:hypothetical protein
MNPLERQSRRVTSAVVRACVIETPLPNHGTSILVLKGYLPLIPKAGREAHCLKVGVIWFNFLSPV